MHRHRCYRKRIEHSYASHGAYSRTAARMCFDVVNSPLYTSPTTCAAAPMWIHTPFVEFDLDAAPRHAPCAMSRVQLPYEGVVPADRYRTGRALLLSFVVVVTKPAGQPTVTTDYWRLFQHSKRSLGVLEHSSSCCCSNPNASTVLLCISVYAVLVDILTHAVDLHKTASR